MISGSYVCASREPFATLCALLLLPLPSPLSCCCSRTRGRALVSDDCAIIVAHGRAPMPDVAPGTPAGARKRACGAHRLSPGRHATAARARHQGAGQHGRERP